MDHLIDLFALEIRNKELLGNEESCTELNESLTLVSVDSPDYRDRIFPGKIIYMKMHGRDNWYSYNYFEKEISKTIRKIKGFEAEKVYMYFNNGHNMLENSKLALKVWLDM